MSRTILVTGGAGYIGSHTALALLEQGNSVVVVDNLCNSSSESIDRVKGLAGNKITLVKADVANPALMDEIFTKHKIDAVIHFAGLKAVGESVEQPLRYYRANLESTMTLLDTMAKHKVWDLVFSSSATVYGDPETLPIPESAPTGPTNPYGRTKLMIEDICRDVAAADPKWRIALLRYFNPVGAHPSGDIGEDPTGPPNNLVPFVMQVAVGRREKVSVFGSDYDTPDGTGVRDYIHVVDLALGHLAALAHIQEGCREFNLGTGTGASVLEIISATEEVAKQPVAHEIVDRRAGDIATSLADPTRANSELQWSAERTLDSMLKDAWNWQSKNPNGFAAEGA